MDVYIKLKINEEVKLKFQTLRAFESFSTPPPTYSHGTTNPTH